MKQNAALPLPPSQKAATWLRCGVVQSAQPESVPNIIARYRTAIFQAAPAGRPFLEHMMDLEVQAATANTRCEISYATVQDTINRFVDAFISDWLAANPKPR
jgi:hypothetical protein